METIPGGMLDPAVPAAAAIHEYHKHNGQAKRDNEIHKKRSLKVMHEESFSPPCLPTKRVQTSQALALRRLGSGITDAVRNGGGLVITVALPGAADQLQHRQQCSHQNKNRKKSCEK